MTRRVLALRGRVVLTFAIGGALVSLLLAVTVFAISRGYLIDQRERSAQRLASTDAEYVASRLADPAVRVEHALVTVDPPTSRVVMLYRHGAWLSSRPEEKFELPPVELRVQVSNGNRGTVPSVIGDIPYMVIGIPLAPGTEFYEFAPVTELRATIGALGTILLVSAALTTIGAALLGLWASRRVVRPLRSLAATAESIASGRLDSRLPEEGDRDLAPFVASFNTMVASLQDRIDRERRFVGDVTHELRTPLTTLVTGVEVMRRQSDELPDRSRRALDLVNSELDHLRRMVDDLLDLARAEAGVYHDEVKQLPLRELLVNTLEASSRSPDLLDADTDGLVNGRKLALVRAFTNLMDNADRHGGGLRRVVLREVGGKVVVHVDDDGPGVPEKDRERVFARFATGHGARRSSGSTGLGLALVAETINVHSGTVRCRDNPAGGARFTVTLPQA